MDDKIIEEFCSKFKTSLNDIIKTNTDFTFKNLVIIFKACYKVVSVDNEIKITFKQIREKATSLAKTFDHFTETDKHNYHMMDYQEIDKIIDKGNKILEKKKNNLTYRAANRRFGSGSFDRKAAKRIFEKMKNHIPTYKHLLWYVSVDGYHILVSQQGWMIEKGKHLSLKI